MRIMNHIRALIVAVRNRYSEQELDSIGKPEGSEFITLRQSIDAVMAWMERLESLDKTMNRQGK